MKRKKVKLDITIDPLLKDAAQSTAEASGISVSALIANMLITHPNVLEYVQKHREAK